MLEFNWWTMILTADNWNFIRETCKLIFLGGFFIISRFSDYLHHMIVIIIDYSIFFVLSLSSLKVYCLWNYVDFVWFI